jgi:hypothetical protein
MKSQLEDVHGAKLRRRRMRKLMFFVTRDSAASSLLFPTTKLPNVAASGVGEEAMEVSTLLRPREAALLAPALMQLRHQP